MSDFTLVIVSGSVRNLSQCLRRVDDLNPLEHGRIVVVIDEGKRRAYQYEASVRGDWPADPRFIEAPPPFNFSRFVNLGIAARTTPNVILMEDDSLLMTPLGLDKLNALVGNHTFGACSAEVWGTVCNPRLKPKATWRHFRLVPDMVTTMCLAIPERTLKKLNLQEFRRAPGGFYGPFEERITAYGKDDWDFSKRVLAAGLTLAVTPLCCVEHDRTLKSFWRSKPDIPEQITTSRREYMELWDKEPRLVEEDAK